MKKVLTSAALAVAALAASMGAQANVLRTTIGFEAGDTDTSTLNFAPLLQHGDEFYQAGIDGHTMWIDPFSNASGAANGDFVGALLDGSDASSCASVVCPTNNASTYLAVLNDGAIVFGAVDGYRFSVKSFSASWISNGDPIQANPGFVRLQGVRNGVSTTATFALAGFDANNKLNFATFNTGAFGNTEFDVVYAYGFACPPPGRWHQLHSFNTDRAQFGLDDITIEHVPEPGSFALLSLAGFAAFRASRRRRAV